MRYILIDQQNLFMRVRYGVRAPDLDSHLGMALHIIFQSIKKVWNQYDDEKKHLVFCTEGRSWRKNIYKPYKANRKVTASQRTAREIEEDALFFQVMDQFIEFLKNKTNCTVLRHGEAEADDLIARWIQIHDQDQHVIISSDSDFKQLIAPNVMIYDGIAALLYTHTGVVDKDGKPAIGKNGQPLPVPDPEWLLFEKCLRGDASDNVMSAYPRVRTTQLLEAFADRTKQGFAWNNLMLSKWVDHEGVDHRVKDDYARNRQLIDLTQQPADLIEKFDLAIKDSINVPLKNQVGIALMQFSSLHGLVKIEKNVSEYSACFSTPYQGKLLESLESIE
jgi:hypothetical protein